MAYVPSYCTENLWVLVVGKKILLGLRGNPFCISCPLSILSLCLSSLVPHIWFVSAQTPENPSSSLIRVDEKRTCSCSLSVSYSCIDHKNPPCCWENVKVVAQFLTHCISPQKPSGDAGCATTFLTSEQWRCLWTVLSVNGPEIYGCPSGSAGVLLLILRAFIYLGVSAG